MTDADLTYVYAIAWPPGPDAVVAITAMSGVDDAPVRVVSHGDLMAVVSSVPAAAFDEAAMRERLEQMDTLESLARAHHTVVDAAAAHGTVLPLRMATVYRGDERVTEMLTRGRERFAAALDRLTGAMEWGVKVYTEPAPAASPSTAQGSGSASGSAEPARETSGSNMGRDYLRRRKEQRRSADEAWRQASGFAERVDAELCDRALDVRHYRPQNPKLSGARGDNVLNAAYLVSADGARAFAETARALDGSVPGTRVELTGPWAPYSFTLPEPEQDVVDADAPPAPTSDAPVSGSSAPATSVAGEPAPGQSAPDASASGPSGR